MIPVVVGSSPIIHPSLVRISGCSFSCLREMVPKADEGLLKDFPHPLPSSAGGRGGVIVARCATALFQ